MEFSEEGCAHGVQADESSDFETIAAILKEKNSEIEECDGIDADVSKNMFKVLIIQRERSFFNILIFTIFFKSFS